MSVGDILRVTCTLQGCAPVATTVAETMAERQQHRDAVLHSASHHLTDTAHRTLLQRPCRANGPSMLPHEAWHGSPQPRARAAVSHQSTPYRRQAHTPRRDARSPTLSRGVAREVSHSRSVKHTACHRMRCCLPRLLPRVVAALEATRRSTLEATRRSALVATLVATKTSCAPWPAR